jgi:hypothetical protein
MSDFMKIHPVTAELFHADGETDKHGEAYRHFSHNFANAPQNDLYTDCHLTVVTFSKTLRILQGLDRISSSLKQLFKM